MVLHTTSRPTEDFTTLVATKAQDFHGLGSTFTIKGVGTVHLTSLVDGVSRVICLKNVLWVPQLPRLLVSERRIMLQGYQVENAPGHKSLYEGKVRVARFAWTDADMYSIVAQAKPFAPSASIATTAPVDIQVWHQRLGHTPVEGVRKLAQSGDVVGLPLGDVTLQSESSCEACVQGKAHRLPFPSSSARASAPLELLHTDVVTMPVPGNKGERYILTVLDDYSRKAWIFCLKQKSDVATALKQFRARVELETGRQIKIVRSDNGTEYVNEGLQTYFANAGIVNQRSAPYTPAQNGRAERLNRTLVRASCRCSRTLAHPNTCGTRPRPASFTRTTAALTPPPAIAYRTPCSMAGLQTCRCCALLAAVHGMPLTLRNDASSIPKPSHSSMSATMASPRHGGFTILQHAACSSRGTSTLSRANTRSSTHRQAEVSYRVKNNRRALCRP